MSHADRMSFKMMSFIHETLYGLFRDPFKVLTAAGLEVGQRVLEVGCGPGFFTIPAARMVGEAGSLLAVDVNAAAVEHVRRKIEAAGVTNAQVMVANAADMDLPDGSFDLVFLFGLARPVGEMDRIWNEMYRLLRPGGTLSVEGRLRPPADRFRPVKRQGRVALHRKAG